MEYRKGRIFGTVFFDEKNRYTDATRQTQSSVTRGFVDDVADLPAGVYDAAKAAAKAAV